VQNPRRTNFYIFALNFFAMSAIFPASYSTLSTLALASMLSERYGFADVTCELLLRGVGDTYLVETAGDSYILRAYRSSHRSFSQIKAEMELLLALKEAGVPAAYPIADVAGREILAVEAAEGTRHLVLFNYAPGHAAATLSETQLRTLGHQMARFHAVSSTITLSDPRWNFDFETTLHRPIEMLKHAFREDPEGYAWVQQSAGKAEQALKELGASEFPAGYCHFDFLPKNFHFDGDSLTFFDFDFLGYGWLVYDVMTFWQHLCLDVHFGRMKQTDADEAYAIFVKAYGEVRPLSAAELKAVPWLSLGWWLFYMGFHTTHDQFYPFVQPAHLKLRMGLMRQLMGRYWEKEG
jgi:Ser/Thr protein kinase RdoA (MazF antagonist)